MDILEISKRNDERIKMIENLQSQWIKEEIIQLTLEQCDRIIRNRRRWSLS